MTLRTIITGVLLSMGMQLESYSFYVHRYAEAVFWPIPYALKGLKSQRENQLVSDNVTFGLYMLLAITVSDLVLGGNARFYSLAKTVANIIIRTANEASESIYNATGVMKEIRDNLGAISIAEGLEIMHVITT
ncbi:hypothetical protein SLA2020_093930 [Shorea laevis]